MWSIPSELLLKSDTAYLGIHRRFRFTRDQAEQLLQVADTADEPVDPLKGLDLAP